MASSSSTCMVNSPIRFMALIQFRLHRIALALLERGVDPADRFLTPLLEPEDLYAQLARQKLHRRVTQKPQNDLTLARQPSLAKSQRACRQAWPGENVDEPSSPAFTTGPATATFFSKLSVMFRSSLDTSIKPILCPRKSGPTETQKEMLAMIFGIGIQPFRLESLIRCLEAILIAHAIDNKIRFKERQAFTSCRVKREWFARHFLSGMALRLGIQYRPSHKRQRTDKITFARCIGAVNHRDRQNPPTRHQGTFDHTSFVVLER